MHEGINTVFSTMIYATRKNQVASFIDKKKKKKKLLFSNAPNPRSLGNNS
jgi:translation initiation factor 2B subunit (eIF-2B alpha/beta/delta family)